MNLFELIYGAGYLIPDHAGADLLAFTPDPLHVLDLSSLNATATAATLGAVSGSTPASTISLVAPVASGVLYPGVPVTLVFAVNGDGTVEAFTGVTSLGTGVAANGLAFVVWTPTLAQWGSHSLTGVVNSVTSSAVSVQVGPSSVLGAYIGDPSVLTEADTTTPENGDAVATWASLTGSNNGTAAANRPTFTASDAAFNGNSTVAFASASSQRMPLAGIFSSFSGNPGVSHTIVARLKPTTLAANMTFFSVAQASTANGSQRWFFTTAGNLRFNVTGNGGTASVSGAASLTIGLVAGTSRVFSCQYSASTRIPSAWAANTRTNAAALSAAVGQVTPDNATIGCNLPLTPAEFFNGSLEGLWILSGVDDTTVRENLESLELAKQGSTAPGVGEYDTSAYGLHGFSTSGFYRAPAIALPRSVAVLFRFTKASASARALLSAYQTDGWEITLLASGAIQVTGASASVVTTALAVIDQITGVHVSDDGAGNIKIRVNRGVEQTVAAAISVATHEVVLGARSVSHDTVAQDVHILGAVLSTSTIQTQIDADTWFDNCKALQDCADLASGTTHRWSVKDKMSDLVIDSTWTASTGSVGLARFGTLVSRELAAANQVWGWT